MDNSEIVWKYVCKQFEIKMGAEFVFEYNSDLVHRISRNGLEYWDEEVCEWKESHLVGKFLAGKLGKVFELLWSPKVGKLYYYVTWESKSSDSTVKSKVWNKSEIDETRLAIGNCFQTKEEAEDAKDNILERILDLREQGF